MLNKLQQRLDNAAKKMIDTTRDIVGDKVSEELRTERMNICLSCEKLYKPTTTCKACGCFMSAKTWMPRQACPLGKWGIDPTFISKS